MQSHTSFGSRPLKWASAATAAASSATVGSSSSSRIVPTTSDSSKACRAASRLRDTAVVVHYQAVAFLSSHAVVVMSEGPVDPCHGLEQTVFLQPPVEVQHLFHGSVEPGEQHVHDDPKPLVRRQGA